MVFWEAFVLPYKTMKVLCIRPKESSVWNYRMTRPLKSIAVFRKTLLRKNEEIQIGELAKRLYKISPIWNIKYLKCPHTADVLISMRNAVKATIVMDIDDNIWQIPPGNIMRNAEGWDKYVAVNTALLECCDWVTVSTEPLKEILLPLNENIVVLPNLIDPKEWKFKRERHKNVRIAWVWSPTHIPDVQVVAEAMEEINKKYDVEIVIFGKEKNLFNFSSTNIKGVSFVEYPKIFTEKGIDISICPLLDNDFNKCKSNIKFLESTMAGAAVVASAVYPYANSIIHGETGFLAKDTKEWIKYLSILIEDEVKRKELCENAKKEVIKNYNVETNKKWIEFYQTL